MTKPQSLGFQCDVKAVTQAWRTGQMFLGAGASHGAQSPPPKAKDALVRWELSEGTERAAWMQQQGLTQPPFIPFSGEFFQCLRFHGCAWAGGRRSWWCLEP